VFYVPDKLIRILDRDLKAAGIAKRDERGRTLDVHAIRHSFGTLLSKGGVAPRTAQAAMRHSSLDLTMNVYTDPKLLDVHGALDVLPALPLNGESTTEGFAAKATGTDNSAPSEFAPGFAPTPDKTGESQSTSVNLTDADDSQVKRTERALNADAVKRNKPLTTTVNGLQQVGDTGLEPVTPSLSS